MIIHTFNDNPPPAPPEQKRIWGESGGGLSSQGQGGGAFLGEGMLIQNYVPMYTIPPPLLPHDENRCISLFGGFWENNWVSEHSLILALNIQSVVLLKYEVFFYSR